jgi:hypothetical protein
MSPRFMLARRGRRRTRRTTNLALMFCLLALVPGVSVNIGLQQRQKAKPYALAAVSGETFLTTRGGGLKVARMANVYVLGASLIHKYLEVAKQMRGSRNERLQALLNRNTDSAADAETTACRFLMRENDETIARTIAWATENDQESLHTTETDENGFFRLGRLKPGNYLVVVRGQAEGTEAEWESRMFNLKAGETMRLKMSAPLLACLNP